MKPSGLSEMWIQETKTLPDCILKSMDFVICFHKTLWNILVFSVTIWLDVFEVKNDLDKMSKDFFIYHWDEKPPWFSKCAWLF